MRRGFTPYHKVVAARLARSKEARNAQHANRYTEIDRFMCQYEQAYLSYYRVPIVVTYSHGWYYVKGLKVRHSTLQWMTNSILALLQEEQSPQPIEEENSNV